MASSPAGPIVARCAALGTPCPGTVWSGYSEPVTAETHAPGQPGASTPSIPLNPGRRDLGMRATMIFPNREIVEKYYVPLIYTACRTCYSELAPDDIFERAVDGRITPEKQRELIGRVIESGHGSTIEHVVFTFAITGVSRTLSHQLVRHRAGVAFDQQSQRYVSYKKGATTIVITASGSPLALLGQGNAGGNPIVLAVDHPEDYDRYSPMVSRLLHLTVIDILTTAVALRLPGELRPMLQEIKKNLRLKRYAPLASGP